MSISWTVLLFCAMLDKFEKRNMRTLVPISQVAQFLSDSVWASGPIASRSRQYATKGYIHVVNCFEQVATLLEASGVN